VILVSIILFLFLGNVRGAIIVALTIPFALLFASICLDLSHIPANLLSLGALDFGMVVDGAVVMIENIVRHLSHEDDTRTRGRRFARQHMKCSGRSSTQSASSSARIAYLYLAGGGGTALQADGLDGCVRAAGALTSRSSSRRFWPAWPSTRAPGNGRIRSCIGLSGIIASRFAQPLSIDTSRWALPVFCLPWRFT